MSDLDLCFQYFASDHEQATVFLNTFRDADSIVLLGALCDAKGLPEAHTRLRCEVEGSLKRHLSNYRHTIVSGGRRGVEAYRRSHPSATEAGQIVQYCVNRGESITDYLGGRLKTGN